MFFKIFFYISLLIFIFSIYIIYLSYIYKYPKITTLSVNMQPNAPCLVHPPTFPSNPASVYLKRFEGQY